MDHFPHPAHEEHINRNIRVNSKPAFLTITSAGRCNLKCVMCNHSMIEEIKVNLDLEKIYPLLETAGSLQLVGGEPLWITENVNVTTGRILDKITNDCEHLRITAITNGVMLNKKMAEVVFKHFESINFSIDTLDPAAYKKIRSQAVLNTVLENMRYLSGLKKEAGFGLHDTPQINIFSVVMNSTLDQLPSLTGKLAQLGGCQHVLLKLRNLIGEKFDRELVKEIPDFQNIPESRLDPIRKELKKICSESGIEIADHVHLFSDGMAEQPKPASRNAVCPNPWKHASIAQNGDVFFCCTNTTVFGNINEQDFDEIWNGPVALKTREFFIKGVMKGCQREACMAPADYFTVPENQLSCQPV